MGSDTFFPEDPTQPKFEDHVSDLREITIAWKKQHIALGKGLLLSETTSETPNLGNAFRSSKGKPAAVFNKDSNQSYREVVSSNTSQSSEHLSGTIGVSVKLAGGLLAAGVSASFDKQVSTNSDSEKISFHSSFRFGTITFASLPKLTYEAYSAVPTRSERQQGIDAFKRIYGDYYVGGLVLGADNAVMVSSYEKTEQTEEKLSLSIRVKVLCWSHTKTITKTEAHTDHTESMSLTAYDTLEDIFVSPPARPTLPSPLLSPAWLKAVSDWAREAADQRFDLDRFQQLVIMGRIIEERAWQAFNSFGLQDGDSVSDDLCVALCQSGLVCSIILVPFSKCIDYVVAKNRS